MTDKEIIDIFFTRKGNLRSLTKLLTEEISSYLELRYSQFNTYEETLWRLKLNYEDIPICPICKYRPIKFSSKVNGFNKTCSKECANKLWKINQTKTVKEKYGVDNYYASDEFKEKLKQHNLNTYGTEYYMSTQEFKDKAAQTNNEKYGVNNGGGSLQSIEKIKSTCLKKYNVENPFQSEEIKNKIKDTNLKKYGVEHYSKTKEFANKIKTTSIQKYGVSSPTQTEQVKNKIKSTNLERYGVECVLKQDYIKEKIKKTNLEKYGVEQAFFSKEVIEYTHSPAIIQKQIDTKRKNHTFNTSKQEEYIANLLKNLYGDDNVKCQYKSKVYPYLCDFYIVSEDLYIECNFHWTHGPHRFNSSNKNDLLLLEKWKTKNTKFYNNAINTWTVRDINKYNIAEQNKLNYKVFYSKEECELFIKIHKV